MTPIFFLVTMLSMSETVFDLQPLPREIPKISRNLIGITSDTVLVGYHENLYELTMNGEMAHTYSFEDEDGGQPWHVANFAFIKKKNLIAVVLGRENQDEDGEKFLEHRLRFYDRGAPGIVIPGYDNSQEEREMAQNVYYRQILPTEDGRIFVNLWDEDNLAADKALLIEVRIIAHLDGLSFMEIGEPFNVQHRGLEKWSAKFKKRWIVSDRDELKVVGEMQPVLKSYAPKPNAKKGVYNEDENDLELAGWVQPYKRFKGLSTREQRSRWANSFSRQAGTFELADGLVTGFTSPNRQHTYYSRPGETGSDQVPFVLNLQRMKLNGANIGPPVRIPGGFLVGVQDQSVWVILKGENQYSLGKVAF